jgi:hypothetical protein
MTPCNWEGLTTEALWKKLGLGTALIRRVIHPLLAFDTSVSVNHSQSEDLMKAEFVQIFCTPTWLPAH